MVPEAFLNLLSPSFCRYAGQLSFAEEKEKRKETSPKPQLFFLEKRTEQTGLNQEPMSPQRMLSVIN